MSSLMNFELTISELVIPNYSGPLKCALVLANFSTTVSIPCKPFNMINLKVDSMDKLYLSVFTQSCEVGCLEIPYTAFSNGFLESNFRLLDSSISPEKERGQLKIKGEVHLKIAKLDDICLRCEGLEKLVRDIKVNMYEIEDTIHCHPAHVRSLSVSSPMKESISCSMLDNESLSVSLPTKEPFASSIATKEAFYPSSSSIKDGLSSTMPGKDQLGLSSTIKDDKKSPALRKNPKSKALRSVNPATTEKPLISNTQPANSEQDLKKMLEESYKSRQDLMSSIDETANNLTNQLKDQGESLDKALADRSAAMDQLLKVNHDLSKIQQENQELMQALEEKDLAINNLKPKASCSESYENGLQHLTEQLEKSISENNGLEKKLKESLDAFSLSNGNLNKRIQDLTAEKADLMSKLEELIKQNHSLRHENDRLTNLANELCAQIAMLQAEIEAARARENREKHLQSLLKEAQEAKNLMKKELDAMGDKFGEQTGKMAKENSRLLNEKNLLESQLLNSKIALEDKNKEISKLKRDLEKALTQIANLEKNVSVTKDLNSTIGQLNRQNSDLESHTRKLSDQLFSMKNTIESQDEMIRSQDEKITELENARLESEERVASLESIIDELRKERLEICEEKGSVYKPIRDDPIDIALSDYVNTRPSAIKVQFDREDHGIYNFGTKKIFVKLEQGKLLIRVGGGYMQVEDFVKLYSPVELERFSNAKKEQAQKIRQSYLGKYADKLSVNKNKNEISPERAVKILKDQMASGAYTPYYAVQIKSPERSANRSPVAFEKMSRSSN